MSINAYGQNIERTYDSLGRLTQIVYPDSSIITYIYDNNGNLLNKQAHDPCDTKHSPVITPLGPTVFCHEDTLQLTTEPALQYHWSTGDTTQTIKVTTTGSYSVTVIDSFKVFDDTLQCQLTSDTIAVNVKPLPQITPVADQIVCNGDTAISIIFSSTLDSTVFNWSGSSNQIGIPQNGTGNISSFMVINAGNTTIIDTIIVTPLRNDCNGKSDTFTITVHPTPMLDTISDQVICSGLNSTMVQINGSVAGTQYTWTNSDTSIGLAATGSNNIPSFTAQNLTNMPVMATVAVVGTYSGCSSVNENFTITINPTPNIDSVPSQVLCNGANTTTVTFTGAVSGSAFSWTNNTTSIGLGATGTGTIPAFTGNNVTNLPIISSIIVTPSANNCTGPQESFTITVNPTPTVDTISNQVVCNGGNAGDIIFSGSTAGTTYAWSNSTTSIGLNSSGIDSIPSFTALNIGTTPVIAAISVTPSANSCPGLPKGFTITVNPTPTVNTIPNQNLCNGTNTNPITFTGTVSNTTYHWSNSNYTIGLDSVGTGNIAAFQVTNTGSILTNATVTVVPKVNNCTGSSKDFTIAVKPTPSVNTPSNQVICNGDTTTTVIFTGSVANSLYTWANSDTSIGLGSSGVDTIPAFITDNFTNIPRTATITTTPTANGCTGQYKSFTILVNPTPSVNPVSDYTYCNGDVLQTIPFTGSVNNTSFYWSNDKIEIGLDSVGVNTIDSFIIKNLDSIPEIANIVVTPKAYNCFGTSKSFNVTVNPTPNVVPVADQFLCNGFNMDTITFIGSVANTSFHWINSDTSIGLSSNNIGSIPSFTGSNNVTYPLTGSITVQPIANNCTGQTDTFTITVNPTPNVFPSVDITACNADSIRVNNFGGNVWGTVFEWKNSDSTIGLDTFGTGNISDFQALNDSNVIISAKIRVTPIANNCIGPSDTFEIFIKPTPKLDSIADQQVCDKSLSDSVVYKSSVAGTTYGIWSDHLYSIGYMGNALQGIPAFTAKNDTDTPISARIRVLPTANVCIGLPDTFVITANPTPRVGTVLSQVLCENDSTTYISFSGNVTSSVFNWRNNDTAIGLAEIGSGDIQKFKALNPTDTLRIALIEVTAKAYSCEGPKRNVLISVKPKPSVDTVPDYAYCNGTMFPPLVFTGNVANTQYHWSNNTTSIGLAQSGVDSVFVPKLINTGTQPVVSVITTVPIANNCIGDSMIFKLRVNPTPYLDTIYSSLYCNNDTTAAIIFTSSVDSTSYSWQNSNPSIGIPINGLGNILPFAIRNTGTIQIEGIFTVLPTAHGCQGPSREFSIKVNPTLITSINILSKANGVICDGMADTFLASVTNGGTTPVYSWKINGIDSGGNSHQFIARALIDGDIVSCELTSNATCAEPPVLLSNQISMTVNPNLIPLVSLNATPGTLNRLWKQVKFNTEIKNGGTLPTYIWQKNGVVMEGVTGNSYTGKTGVDLLPDDIICVKILSSETCLAVDTAISCERAIVISDIDKGSRLDYISLHPNPNKGNFILQGHIYTDRQIDVKVLNAAGGLTYKTVVLPVNNTVNSEIRLDDYPNGVYFVWLILGEDVEPKIIRFVISK